MKNKITGLALVSFLASIAGIVISFLLLKEDVTSTAHTLFEYFPMKYGVIPSSEWNGAIILGLFTSVLQVVSASIMFSKSFSAQNRWLAFIAFVSSCGFDNWTDVVFRSGNLTGDIQVATITTLAFYTVGSEALQGFSWLIFFNTWRQGISDFMWGVARLQSGFSSISSEWSSFKRAASRRESRESDDRIPSDPFQTESSIRKQNNPISSKPSYSVNKHPNYEKPGEIFSFENEGVSGMFQQDSPISIKDKMAGKSKYGNRKQ